MTLSRYNGRKAGTSPQTYGGSQKRRP